MATWLNGTKSALPSYTGDTKHASTFTNPSKTSANPTAAAGQYYGFGAFTYTGGQAMAYVAIPWTNLTKD